MIFTLHKRLKFETWCSRTKIMLNPVHVSNLQCNGILQSTKRVCIWNSKCKRFLCSATALLFDFWNLIDVKKIVTNSLEITLLHNYWIKFQESNCNDDCSGITASWMPARKIRCSLYQFIVRQFPLLLIFSWFNLSHILLKPKLIKGQAFEPLFLLY